MDRATEIAGRVKKSRNAPRVTPHSAPGPDRGRRTAKPSTVLQPRGDRASRESHGSCRATAAGAGRDGGRPGAIVAPETRPAAGTGPGAAAGAQAGTGGSAGGGGAALAAQLAPGGTRLPATPGPFEQALGARVECVPDAVAEQVERERGDQQGE